MCRNDDDIRYLHIQPGSIYRSRYEEHYKTTLAPDLLYMTYNHAHTQNPPSAPRLPEWKDGASNPYTLSRPRPKTRSGVQPSPKPTTDRNLVRLEAIILSLHVKDAAAHKNALIPALAFLSAISGHHAEGFQLSHLGQLNPAGVEVTKTRSKSASFKIRAGQPCGAKVAIKNKDAMYTFLQTLVEFVFPRLKEWNGIPLPPSNRNTDDLPSSKSGALSFGLPREAMALFPQVEIQLDAYSKQHGFHVHCITNAKGQGAQDQARALLSGLRLPFVATQS